jgi:hypothetical protein
MLSPKPCIPSDGTPLVLLVRRRHRMVLVLDAPSTVDLAKADGKAGRARRPAASETADAAETQETTETCPLAR